VDLRERLVTTLPRYEPGSLVHARGRDWVVQPESEPDFLILKPLGGRAEEATGIYLPVEADDVRSAAFGLPTGDDLGDARSASLLRDAARLTARATTGPFRSFGRIAVSPRPYQLVPLLMALRLDPVRLLIADDVGVGKTIEAGLVARELLDRGEARRLTVLCPPHLAEQWQRELDDHFHLRAELVLPSTVRRLERGLRPGESLFERHPFTIVSLDYIKTDRHRAEFLRAAPELVIVDEAHTCADPGRSTGNQQQRHHLLRDLAKKASRHLLLVTATPHSGNEDAFRSLLSLLQPRFRDLPDELSGPQNEALRRDLAKYFVQRKRGDIRHYLDADTPFPEREDADLSYNLTPAYKALFDKVLAYARETLQSGDGSHRQRVRWWAMLSLLRALASSPAAAASTLRNRAAPADTESIAEADEIGRRQVLDTHDDDTSEGIDVAPGAQDTDDEHDAHRRRLHAYAREADALSGNSDAKLGRLITQVRELLADGYAPIVFCRFIPTAEYVAEHLRTALRGVEIAAVTGTLPPDEREARVHTLGEADKRVLVATDCLSEGINLQERFDAVIHYDLSWNPTRHEQRDGRIDRYGQPRDRVRVITMYGLDNQIDGIVLDVLLRKHKTIRTSLGISVPVPANTDQVVEAIFEGLLLRGLNRPTVHQDALFDDFDAYLKPKTADFQRQWDTAVDRERRSRTVFAQARLDPNEVAREYAAAQAALGSEHLLRRFIERVVPAHGGTLTHERSGALAMDLSEAPDALREALPKTVLTLRLDGTPRPGETRLTRTHPLTETLAAVVLDSALDPHANGAARRAGVMRTTAVTTRTVLLLARFRYQITTTFGPETWDTIAEDTVPLAFTGTPNAVTWLDETATLALLDAQPAANVDPGQARHTIERVLDDPAPLQAHLERAARERAGRLLDAHRRVRTAAGAKGLRYAVTPLLPADVLGAYVYLPA
jgi:superfamily II DNA or RNA helicase